jgi:MFS family permease
MLTLLFTVLQIERMVGHVETSGRSLSGSASNASAHTLQRIQSIHSISSAGGEVDLYSEPSVDVDIHHTVELDGEVADKALSPGLRRAFGDTPILLLCAIIGSLNYVCYGYDTGIIGIVQVQNGYQESMGLIGRSAAYKADVNGWVTSSLNLSGAAFALSAGYFGDWIGRKRSLYLACIINIIGCTLQAAALDVGMMIAGRVVTGAGLGIGIAIAPPYIAELSYKSIRGFVGVLSGMSMAFGLFLAPLLSYIMAHSGSFNQYTWRWLLGIQDALALAVLVLLIPLPESPRWLILKGRDMEARKQLIRVRKETVVGRRSKRIRRQRSGSTSTGTGVSNNSALDLTALPLSTSYPSDPRLSDKDAYTSYDDIHEHEHLSSTDVELISIMEEVQHWKNNEKSVTWWSLFEPAARFRTMIAFLLPLFQAAGGQYMILWYG